MELQARPGGPGARTVVGRVELDQEIAPPDALVCGRCGGPLVQRRDDNAGVIRERLRVYAQDTQPLVEYYRRRPTFRLVDGDQPPEAVAQDILAAIAAALGGPS